MLEARTPSFTMSILWSEETIKRLASKIDAQLEPQSNELSAFPFRRSETSLQRNIEPESNSVLMIQAEEIERITQEKPATFLRKVHAAAKQDVCEEGGVLNAQWKQWKNLASADVVKSFGPVLVAMGFSGVLLESLVVATGVTVIHIGLKVFCEEFKENVQEKLSE